MVVTVFLGMEWCLLFIILFFIFSVGFYFAFYLFRHALVIIVLFNLYQNEDKFIFIILFIWLIAAYLAEGFI